ncbi:MAG TPA: hypothetical protein VIX86_20560 [Streptosporangiaceae bacterium]
MRTRLLFGIGAWLLGAVAATGGCLLAVSMLGQGIAASPGQQLTVAMVNRALASESAETPAPLPTPTPTPSPSVQLGGVAVPITRATTPSPSQTPASTPPSPQPSPGTVLSSAGGTVVAECGQGGAYLQSWSPQQSYEAGGVVRGPARTAQVTFTAGQSQVTMFITCSHGKPSATVHTSGDGGGGGGGDD